MNLADFLAFAGGFGARSGDANYNARLDLDGSGAIDLSDFLAFAGVFGTTCEKLSPAVLSDRETLELLYGTTRGAGWINSENWLTDAPMREWYGVMTDDIGRVAKLELVQNGLTGVITPELIRLANLKALDLSNNGLTGLVLPELGQLSNLEVLRLQLNQFSGSVPAELGNLKNLQVLDLQRNEVSGSIPAELGNLTNLESLLLNHNKLSGSIPAELGNLTNLESLLLNHNNLSGSIPAELGNLTGLRSLSLNGNADLSGALPLSFTGLDSLTRLNMDGTGLCLSTESAMQTWHTGVQISIGVLNCVTDRDILIESYNATNGPRWLNQRNWLSGLPLGEWFGVNTDSEGRVTKLRLDINKLRGSIPRKLGRLSSLQVLDLQRNELSGSVPPELGNLTELETLVLNHNQLSGSVPAELGNLSSLKRLSLNDNAELSGALPLSLTNLDSLTRLDLDGTELTIPTDEAFQTWLREVRNRGRGSDDSGGGGGSGGSVAGDRAVLVAIYGSTSGGSWTNNTNWLSDRPMGEWHGVSTDAEGRVTSLLLNNNQLDGSIPPSIGNLSRLRDLSLKDNNLRGSVPSSIGNLSNLKRLSFQGTGFSGPLPRSFTGLNLTHLYLGSGMCVPTDSVFQKWLEGIANKDDDDRNCTSG